MKYRIRQASSSALRVPSGTNLQNEGTVYCRTCASKADRLVRFISAHTDSAHMTALPASSSDLWHFFSNSLFLFDDGCKPAFQLFRINSIPATKAQEYSSSVAFFCYRRISPLCRSATASVANVQPFISLLSPLPPLAIRLYLAHRRNLLF